MEHKNFPAFITKIDPKGIVEAIVAVMGNIDFGNDVIHSGAFTKTITERLGKFRVLDQHRTDSVLNVVGKCLEIRELPRSELPPELLAKFPEVTGGLYTKTQFLLNTPEGEGVFNRLQAGAIDEWSIGYDALDHDYTKIRRNGKQMTVRNLRAVKLYEYSPVLFGMNEGVGTMSAKGGSTQAEETKPWDIFREDDSWNIYKVDADGKPTGKPLGKHPTRVAAQAQMAALYANTEEGKAVGQTTLPSQSDDKAINLTDRIAKVESAFRAQYCSPYPSVNTSQDFWVREVYDEYIIVCAYRMQGSTEYYQIAYTQDDTGDEVSFAPRAEWVEGEFLFVPKAPVGEMSTASAKAGRVLAARNTARVTQMNELMNQLRSVMEQIMTDAGMMDEPPAGKSSDGKMQAGSETLHVTPPTELYAAGDMLSIIELEMQDLQLTEVSHGASTI